MAHLADKASSIRESAPSALGPKHRASEMETRTRKERKFHETEITLPDIKVNAAPATDTRPALATNVLSYLGSWNPIPLEITNDNTVWLLDNTAYRNHKTNNWEAEFVTAVFDKGTGLEISTVVADLAEKLGVGSGDAAEATIRDRLLPFMQSILPGRAVNVTFGGNSPLRLGPGGRNGISSDIKPLPQYRDGEIIKSSAVVPQGADGILEMSTAFAEPEGWALISDIDDTIKVTQTGDPIGILRSTFVSEATPVAGMPEFYAHIQTLFSTPIPWFYLSASPYNLYPFLSQFRRRFYPQGTMILRDASWMNLAGLLSNLTVGTEEYKVERMQKVNSWLPRRKMILIGDSTQSDPEAYGEIYRKHKSWVKLILIRRVDDIAAVGIEEKNRPKRFEKAFKHLPKDVWHVFDDPRECYALVEEAIRRN